MNYGLKFYSWICTAYSIIRMNNVDYSSPNKIQMLLSNIALILLGGFILGLLNGVAFKIIQKKS